MTYREIGISIHSAYSQGWPDDISQRAFRTETRKLFRDAGWQVEEKPLDSGHCDTVRNGKDALYLHPDLFSGVMQEDHIPELQRLLSGANTFRVLGTDLHRECFDLTDEEYRQRLEEQTERIDNAILEACKTKRKNLFHTGSIAERIGRQFTVRRLTDWEQSGPYIAEGYVGERIEQLIADGQLVTAQTRYGQGLRTATEAELKMTENTDPMQMHF
jgi:hypothetical protein